MIRQLVDQLTVRDIYMANKLAETLSEVFKMDVDYEQKENGIELKIYSVKGGDK